MTDPIADMFSRIKNALNARQETVDIPHSRVKEAIAQILVSEGYLGKTEILKRMEKRFLRITLKYDQNKKGIISGIKRVSKPGRRIYADAGSLPRVQAGFGTAIISSSRGVMTDEEARAQKLGGEVICYIW
ncbi:30S ribosomal protein S8 [candidate division WOR-1 bacterium DG_54_3]|uniref:Small ribosomal subunit protein uS8 n=1 Tax=candidate division WOR-1 bacterium DG_54_3 TaxID=1703775 RepID=A0A0S7Y538_UNCSA|nr:MAG: 30S ribosomal protein S8 [candidate division WOR-1 bacterium DG_54_3]